MVQRSKMTAWVVLAVALGPLVPLVMGLYGLFAGGPTPGVLGLLGLGTALVLMLIGLLVPIRYEITDRDIVIQSGLVRHRVPLRDIVGVRPSRSPLSAPALSLERLRIDYRRGDGESYMLISPEEKGAFVRELGRRIPGAVVEGEHLTLGAGRAAAD